MPPSPHMKEENAVPDENDESQPRNRSRKRRKHTDVFEKSGLSKEERRETRMQQRSLHEHLEHISAPDQLEIAAKKNNEIFKTSVKFSREAVLDADNLHLIAQKYEQHVESMVQVPRFDAHKLVLKMKQKCSTNGQFNWLMLGREAGVCFNALPGRVAFLCGPLAADPTLKKKRERKERRRAEVDLIEAVKPKEVEEGEQEGDPNKLSATEKTIKQMEKSLKKRVKENMNAGLSPEIDACKFLCNPRSFTQTVENIFHFSFLVKKGQAGIKFNDGVVERRGDRTPGLVVTTINGRGSDGDTGAQTQSVLTFTMRDWRAMCEGITEGDLPHREMVSS